MKWSREINKSFMKSRARFVNRRFATATPGFLRGEPVWLAEVAVKSHAEGCERCPYCGGPEDEPERLEAVRHEDAACRVPYVETELKCAKCGKWWRVRSRTASTESVVEFMPPRPDPARSLIV